MNAGQKLLNRRGVTLIGALLASVILTGSIFLTIQLYRSTATSYRKIALADSILGIDDELKIAVMSGMKAYMLRALSTPASPSVDCQAKPLFFTAPAAASSASLSLLGGLTLNLLSTSAQTDIDTANVDAGLTKLCGKTSITTSCGSGLGADLWTPISLASDDVANRSIKDASTFCFCATVAPTTTSVQTSTLSQLSAIAPLYIWFRYRDVYAKDGLTKSCSATRVLADNANMVNTLDYIIFYPEPRGLASAFVYKQHSGIYLLSGLN